MYFRRHIIKGFSIYYCSDRFQIMSAKELIVKARNAEDEAKKKEALMTKSVEKLKQAEEKRQEKGFEMKKMEREFEVNSRTRTCIYDPEKFHNVTIFPH